MINDPHIFGRAMIDPPPPVCMDCGSVLVSHGFRFPLCRPCERNTDLRDIDHNIARAEKALVDLRAKRLAIESSL
jgi:tRNA(Ile2) C34 agmatinyltransferase TiaS